MDIYSLSRKFFDWSYENTDIVKPNHIALYFFIIEHNNRLGWKPKFGLPMEMAKDAIGISNYRTYTKTFDDLVEWGFIKVYQKSKNQYSSNIIGIVNNTIATTKALSKAMQKHSQKHSQKQVHGIVGIDIPITNIPITTTEAEEKKVEVPSNLLETNQVSEKLETGIPPAIPVMGKEPAEINRSQIADECKSDPILTNEEHLKNLMTDKYGEQRQAIQKKFGSKNDMNLFEFVLKEFNDHRCSINKIEDTHFQYSKHLNNWLNYKGQEKVKELLQKYQQTQTPNPKAKYSHYGF